MIVKIGTTIYDSDKEPIMLILNDKDKENIKNMLPSANRFCSFPDGMDKKKIFDWMDINS